MTLADYSFGAFAFLNTARLLGYFPQIVRVHRDSNGAKAVSVFTWLLFSAANIATVSYAMIVSHDAAMATIFALNTLGCLTIVGLTMWRRAGIRKTGADDGASNERIFGASTEKVPLRAKSQGPQILAEMADWLVVGLLRRSARSHRRRIPSAWTHEH
ncbi:hypothetical protein IVA78_21700 [Bradyrhizobium sp. 137]|uniref:hypothetical protein n=1 Tax=Bradyrhizobium sp. 137 TaxID=2782614 RepID=UPI001FFA5A45|nr:hypothetical protein [Bradyrhizobium sp. 137]MCK1757762.1 hypothetical protein [Bradyrhizobium sp. 137]